MKLLCSVDDAGRDRCTKKRGRMAPVSFSTSAWAEQCRLFALRAATRFAIAWLALFNLRLDAIAECLTTAFNRNHMINGEGGRIAAENRVEYVFDQTETVGTVWMGLTFTCCRCHDHKFDPLTQRDYYSLFSFFNNTPVNGGGGDPATAPNISVGTPVQKKEIADLEKKIEQAVEKSKKLEKQLKTIQQGRAAETARNLTAKAEAVGDIPFISANLGTADGNFAQAVVDALKGDFEGVVVLGAAENGNLALVASVSESLTDQAQAGKIIQTIAPIVGGKGGGKPTQARGAGRETNKLDEALAEVQRILAN